MLCSTFPSTIIPEECRAGQRLEVHAAVSKNLVADEWVTPTPED